MKVATLAGEPLEVDELSLIKTGPVLVKMNCRDPFKLRGFVKIFFNKVGYEIRFLLEKYKDKGHIPPSPPHGDPHDEEEEDESEDSNDDSDMKHKRKSDKGQKDQGQVQGPHLGKSSNSKTL
jgi:hypothetical protein